MVPDAAVTDNLPANVDALMVTFVPTTVPSVRLLFTTAVEPVNELVMLIVAFVSEPLNAMHI